MTTITRRLLPWLIGMVAVGAAYELLVALGVIGLGPQPGDAPAGATAIVPLALLALLLVGGLLLAAAIGRSWNGWGRLAVPAAGAAAAAFLVARFYSYDPYYAPYLRRMSEDGLVAGRWIAFLAAATLASGLLVRRWPRAAAAGTAVGVWRSRSPRPSPGSATRWLIGKPSRAWTSDCWWRFESLVGLRPRTVASLCPRPRPYNKV